jgi:predicted O-methyltransferase YrrM
MRLVIELAINFVQKLRFKFGLDRKRYILKHIRKYACVNILEIGVFNGNFAYRMLNTAKKKSPNLQINYVGVDLFEANFSAKIALSEVSLTPKNKLYIEEYLRIPNVNVNLVEGYSSSVLPSLDLEKKFDLIVIDGGHSYSTVKNDFENSLNLIDRNGTIIFDDYTNNKGVVHGQFGINQVVNEIDQSKFKISVSLNRDFFWKSYGLLVLKMVKVRFK